MEFISENFSNVPINTNQQNPCSPKEPGIEWTGILINGPLKVILDGDENNSIIPICGFYRLRTQMILNSDPLKINVVLPETDKVVSKFIVKKRTYPSVPNPHARKVKPEEVKNQIVAIYWNYNVLDYFDFPLIPGKYKFFAEYAGEISNTITINLENKQ